MVCAQALMEIRLTLRRAESLLVTLLIPAALLLFLGAAPVMKEGAERAVDFLLPGVLALAVMSTGMVSLGISTAFERQYGVLKRLGGSPLSRGGLLSAKVLAVLAIEAVQVGLLFLIAVAMLGWQPLGSPLPALVVLILGSVTFAAIGLLMAGCLRAEAVLGLANGLYLTLLLLGDMVFPLRNLPAWLEGIARLLPAAALAETLRGALGEGPLPIDRLLLLIAWGLASLIVASRTFRWE